MFERRDSVAARVAVLGWGSLLWDASPRFDDQHEAWQFDGPEIRLEFSRVSQRRNGALTLVIDPVNGAPCRVAYATSRRTDPEDAIDDLLAREGTGRSNLGFLFADETRVHARDPRSREAIRSWERAKGYDAVVWTDLPGNFSDHWVEPFRVDSAWEYLQSLEPEAKSEAAKYVRLAPSFVDTPLRRFLQAQPGFGSPA